MNKKIQLLAIALIFIVSAIAEVYAQQAKDAQLYGRVVLPVVKKKNRAFRGRIYRKRLSESSDRSSSGSSNISSYEDVIIAAYPLSFKADVKPLPNKRIIQRNATFIPNVLAITPGTKVDFINADHFFHNVFSISPGAKFNIGRRPTNTVVTRTIYKSGSISLFCDIHSRMASTIVSLNTPYFTMANRNGVYLLENLPPGKYRIEAIHPDFEKVVIEVTLKDGESVQESFTFIQ